MDGKLAKKLLQRVRIVSDGTLEPVRDTTSTPKLLNVSSVEDSAMFNNPVDYHDSAAIGHPRKIPQRNIHLNQAPNARDVARNTRPGHQIAQLEEIKLPEWNQPKDTSNKHHISSYQHIRNKKRTTRHHRLS
ncbi:hypothetical protein K3495_g9987 [Podosphaera aphanis]|nr:hypothetical protein K3495_g9987 [Podosphaera aphanis]